MRKTGLLVLVLALLTAAAGCGPSAPAGPTPPSLTITSPATGSMIRPGAVTITVDVSYFNVVNKIGQANAANEGHLYYYMDVDPPTTPGQAPETAPGTFAVSADTSYTWPNVGGGTHTFSVELVNNDNTPLEPPQDVQVTVTVLEAGSATQPTISIVSPEKGESVAAGNIGIVVDVSDFNLVNKLGQAAVAGEGHIIYYMDVDPPTTAGQPATTAEGTYAQSAAESATWRNVPAGTHTFAVELVNNNNTPLNPPATDMITVDVTPVKYAVQLTVQNSQFSVSTITVPPDADISILFENDDQLPHNFSVYATSDFQNSIFVGDMLTGPGTTTYEFTSPAETGTYYFRSDPSADAQMTGQFIVSAP